MRRLEKRHLENQQNPLATEDAPRDTDRSALDIVARIRPALQAINPLRTGTWWQKGYRLLLLAILGVVVYQMYLFLSVSYYSVFNPSSSAIMREQARVLQAQITEQSKAQDKKQDKAKVAGASKSTEPAPIIRYQWVDYESISDTVKRAVIASEDSNFLQHSGVEWSAIWDAYAYNQRQEEKGKSRRRGGSTISQQLAKNLFLSHNRSYIRKGQELIITYMLEGLMSKQRILELYLNIAQFGPNIFGVEQASQTYFKKPASRLSVMEAAKLAALLPNPTRYSQQMKGQFINSRANTISQRMRLVTPP